MNLVNKLLLIETSKAFWTAYSNLDNANIQLKTGLITQEEYSSILNIFNIADIAFYSLLEKDDYYNYDQVLGIPGSSLTNNLLQF